MLPKKDHPTSEGNVPDDEQTQINPSYVIENDLGHCDRLSSWLDRVGSTIMLDCR